MISFPRLLPCGLATDASGVAVQPPAASRLRFALLLLPLLALALVSGCAHRTGPLPPEPPPQAPTPKPQPSVVPPFTIGPGGLPVICHTVRSQLGKPYRYGGDSPAKGFDCSGLLVWAFRQHGVELPRSSWEQIRLGRPVKFNQLAPGDLVFFKTEPSVQGYHVGIVTLPGRFAHSPKSGARVSESVLANPYWRDHFITARRLAPK